jgi:Helix-turn-helix domain
VAAGVDTAAAERCCLMADAEHRFVSNHREFYLWLAALYADDELTPAQKVVGARIALHLNLNTNDSRKGQCNPGVDTLAKGTAFTKRGVQKARERLVTLGWIVISRQGGAGAKDSNSYSLAMMNAGAIRANGGSPIDEAGRVNGDTDKGEPANTGGRTTIHPNSKDNSKENSKSICSMADLDLEFENWFSIYPKHAGKSQARKEFERIIEANAATVEQLIFGAETYAAERAGQDGMFTKKPAKWLCDEGWLDEPVTRSAGPPAFAERETNGFVTLLKDSYDIRNAGRGYASKPLTGHDAILAAATRKARELEARGIAEEAERAATGPPPVKKSSSV